MSNNEKIKKQIIYRSTHRGSKEMDLLIGTFVRKNINKFKDDDLNDLNEFILSDDETLYNLYFDKKVVNHTLNKKISKMFKNFKI
ncbi:succinate dehydrogenase assembly factor 2 [Pelagibacteraceae bacterium]|nr:succinate dehydrogenase assembly factor 2 [Pelagibacteraceae bacterium]